MHLVVDIGNTRTKAAIFSGREWQGEYVFEENIASNIALLLSKQPLVKRSILSSVAKDSTETERLLAAKTQLIVFDHRSALPIKNLYKSPETLGKDRLAAAVGAWSQFKGKSVLVIDAGTAIKIDLVNDQGEFMGGSISPGIEMRFKALNTFTGKLPLVRADKNYKSLTGKNTIESILNGVQNGALYEVQGFVDAYSKQYPGINIVVTGGDASFFELGLKNHIFAIPELVLIGLNEILLFNAKP
ncbi:MAG: type III pantothenate kinase [Bacteroidota bacterium]|nr:type III pantothenate kinase [Bacteroidota bacterium]